MTGFRERGRKGRVTGEHTSLCIADFSSERILRGGGKGGRRREGFLLCDDEIEEFGKGLLLFVRFYEEEVVCFGLDWTICVAVDLSTK